MTRSTRPGLRGVESVEIEEVLPQHEIEARLPADLRGPWGSKTCRSPFPSATGRSFAIQVVLDGLGRDGIARVRQDVGTSSMWRLDSRLESRPSLEATLDAGAVGRIPGTAPVAAAFQAPPRAEHGQDPVVDPPDIAGGP